MRNIVEDSVRIRFYEPVERALSLAPSYRNCPEFTDEDFLESGIGRVIAPVQSGRDWVQRLQMWMDSSLSVGNFFQSLKSARRLDLLQEVSDAVRDHLDTLCRENAEDVLGPHPELDNFAVYASDGHYEEHAAHSPKIDGKSIPSGFFYSLSLRTHSLDLLDIARPKKKREHDMTMLKRLTPTQLRMGQAKGVKVIHVYDPAGVDYEQWRKWKTQGIYLISRQKKNSWPDVIGENPWDPSDPRNIGVLSDQLVGTFSGALLRRVRYQDPATEMEYVYLTSEFTLPPGLIAYLYKVRWDVEKVFDQKKNKLREKKAWATSPVAHTQQALFNCLAHNLLVILELRLKSEEQIHDEKVHQRGQQRAAKTREAIRKKGGVENLMALHYLRPTQRSLQFIRWLRHCLDIPTSWSDGLRLLRPLMENYLC